MHTVPSCCKAAVLVGNQIYSSSPEEASLSGMHGLRMYGGNILFYFKNLQLCWTTASWKITHYNFH